MSVHEAGSATRPLNALRRTPRPGRRALRRLAAAGIVGSALTASGLVGGVTATASGAVVVETCTGESTSDAFGQPIVAAPEALDAKVEQATLLVYPLQFDRADRARQQFLNTATVSLGSVTEKDQSFAGTTIADALAPRIANLPALGDKADKVNWHVRNMAALGCISGADVTGHAKPAPAPSPSPDEPSQPPAQNEPPQSDSRSGGGAASGSTGTSDDGSQAGAATPAPAPMPSDSGFAPPQAERVVPQDYAYVPGKLPPWSKTRFGQVPGHSPAVGDLAQGSDKETRREQVRAAGSAEPLPANPRSRVALPVFVAAIALAGVTSALVRTWVLRRV